MYGETSLRPEQHGQPGSRPDNAERAPLIVVLLLVQAAIGALETLVTLAFAGATPLGVGLGLLSAALVCLLVVVAAGVVRGWRWVRIAATVFEGLVLSGAALRLLVRQGSLPGLVWLLSDVALPIAVIDLLWIRLAQAARPALSTPQANAISRPPMTVPDARPASRA